MFNHVSLRSDTFEGATVMALIL